MDGELQSLESLRLHDFLHCFFYGAGFFETFLVSEGRPLFLERHLGRLRASLSAHEDCVQAPSPELLTSCSVRDVLRRCLEADATLGKGFTGVGKLVAGDGRLLLTFQPLSPHHERTQREGVVLEGVEERGYRKGDPTPRHKSVSYLRQYAQFGKGKVFANEFQELCEAPNGNLFFLLDEAWVTPPLHAPCLPGTIRAVLLEAGWLGGLPVVEREVPRGRTDAVRGCILTNSVSLALGVRSLLGHALPESQAWAERARVLVRERAQQEG